MASYTDPQWIITACEQLPSEANMTPTKRWCLSASLNVKGSFQSQPTQVELFLHIASHDQVRQQQHLSKIPHQTSQFLLLIFRIRVKKERKLVILTHTGPCHLSESIVQAVHQEPLNENVDADGKV